MVPPRRRPQPQTRPHGTPIVRPHAPAQSRVIHRQARLGQPGRRHAASVTHRISSSSYTSIRTAQPVLVHLNHPAAFVTWDPRAVRTRRSFAWTRRLWVGRMPGEPAEEDDPARPVSRSARLAAGTAWPGSARRRLPLPPPRQYGLVMRRQHTRDEVPQRWTNLLMGLTGTTTAQRQAPAQSQGWSQY